MTVSGINSTNYTAGVNKANANIPPPPSLNQMLSNFTSQLNLSDDQAAQLKQILQSNLPNQGNDSGSATDKQQTSTNTADKTHIPDRSQMKARMDSMNKQISNILTPDQQKTFQQMIASMESQAQSKSKEQGYY